MIDLNFAKVKEKNLDEISYEVIIDNLNIGTKYYVKVILEQYALDLFISESVPSESTDGIIIGCPHGAYCGIVGGNGVKINEIKNLNGYYETIDNTFVKCNIEKNCPGITFNENGITTFPNQTLEGCLKGHRGILCLNCAKNYTKVGDDCNICVAPLLQVFYMIASLFIGILMYSYLIYKQIKGRGNPKKISAGIIKITIRQFQLAGIISQYPLTWSNEIKSMFSIFNVVSNAGSR